MSSNGSFLPSSGSISPSNQQKIRQKYIFVGLSCYIIGFLIGCYIVPRCFLAREEMASMTSSIETRFLATMPSSSANPVQCLKNGKPIVDVFPGAPWRTDQTLSSELLLSDGRMRVESHTIRGEDGKTYTDWIWMDVIDQINVIPYILPARNNDNIGNEVNKWKGGKFRMFRQRKYGLREETLAVCGGQVEMAKQEEPLEAAKRELEEELSLISSPTSSLSSWVDLGTYRVNVNRGHGMISCFLLLDAVEKPRDNALEASNGGFHIDELERQQNVDLTVEELEQALEKNAFGEIKWMATAARALAEVKKRIAAEDARLLAMQPRAQVTPHSNVRVEHAPVVGTDEVSVSTSNERIIRSNRGKTSHPSTSTELFNEIEAQRNPAESNIKRYKRPHGRKGSRPHSKQ